MIFLWMLLPLHALASSPRAALVPLDFSAPALESREGEPEAFSGEAVMKAHQSALPDPVERDEIFRRAGQPFSEELDQLDRDKICLEAQGMDWKTFSSHHAEWKESQYRKVRAALLHGAE